MVKTRTYKSATSEQELCETYSTRDYKLKQLETGVIYGKSVIDVIAGFDEKGAPFSRFTYEETDEKDYDE